MAVLDTKEQYLTVAFWRAPFKSEIQRIVEAADGDIMATVIYDRLSQREDTPAAPKYAGSYPTLLKLVRSVKEKLKPKEAFLRIETPPGFDAQCDWGKVDLVIGNEEQRISMFILTLSYSRLRFARLFLLEHQECFFQGHVEAFEFFGGVPQQVTYDNLTTAVAKILAGRNRLLKTLSPVSVVNFRSPQTSQRLGKVMRKERWKVR